MVSRLIHQQHIRPAEQHARQCDAHLPAPRQRPDVAIDLVILEAEAMQRLASLRLERVAAEMPVLFLHLAEALQYPVHLAGLLRIPHRVLQAFQLMVQVSDPPAPGNGLIEHRAALHLLHILTKVPDRELFRDRHFALVGSLLADNHAEKRGLARPIGANQSDLLARVQLKGCVDENQLPAILLMDIRKRDHPEHPS